jgi:hypothetical protein
MRLIVVNRRSLFVRLEVMAASIAKLAAWRIHLSAFQARKLEFFTTAVAKPGIIRVFMLTFRAFHGLFLQIVEKNDLKGNKRRGPGELLKGQTPHFRSDPGRF